MTITGAILIPLALVLSLLPWRFILIALPSFALLHGAAVVNFGSIGLQPGYALALLVIMRTGLEVLMLREPLNRDALVYTAPLGVLVVVSILVLWISVCFFTGKITVIGGTDAYILENARPYAFRRENIAQITYLLINTALVYSLAHQSARFFPSQILRLIDQGMIAAATIALGLCGWQLVAHETGIYFPTDFLFSNAGYRHADNQGFFGVLRLNGPFSEPSALAYYFSGFGLYFWKRSRLHTTILSVVLFIALTGAIFLGYSTTGYLVLALFAMVVAFDLITSIRWDLLRSRVNWQKTVIIGIVVLALGGAVFSLYDNWDRLRPILDVSLFQKEKTSSFEVRTGTELMALNIIVQTQGIGVGLGSHKPNSLPLTLLSNIGVVGTFVFLGFLISLLRAPRPNTVQGLMTAESAPLRFFIIGLGFVHLISNPNFNVVLFWAACGLLAGYYVSARRWSFVLANKAAPIFKPLVRTSFRIYPSGKI